MKQSQTAFLKPTLLMAAAALACATVMPSTANAHSRKTVIVYQQQPDIVYEEPPPQEEIQIVPVMSMWWFDNENEHYTLWSDDIWRLDNGRIVTGFSLEKFEIRRVDGRLLLGPKGVIHGGSRINVRSMNEVTSYARKLGGGRASGGASGHQKSARAHGGEQSSRQSRGVRSAPVQRLPYGQGRQPMQRMPARQQPPQRVQQNSQQPQNGNSKKKG